MAYDQRMHHLWVSLEHLNRNTRIPVNDHDQHCISRLMAICGHLPADYAEVVDFLLCTWKLPKTKNQVCVRVRARNSIDVSEMQLQETFVCADSRRFNENSVKYCLAFPCGVLSMSGKIFRFDGFHFHSCRGLLQIAQNQLKINSIKGTN